MTVCISHHTALEFLRGAGSSLYVEKSRSASGIMPTSALQSTGITREYIYDLKRWGIETLPIETIVSAPNLRSKSSYITSHVLRGPYPRDAFLKIENGLLCCSPEFVFMQMGRTLSVVRLAELGMELCGWYSLPQSNAGGDTAGFIQRNPLTTSKRLEHFVKLNAEQRYHSVAQKALRYIADDSASPMETKMALACTLPNARGGYALPKPHFNYKIEHDKGAFYVDLFWPEAKIGLEYDSRQFHSDANRSVRDSQRRNILANLGFDIISVTPSELMNADAFDGIAKRVARALGKRIRVRANGFFEERRLLWAALFRA